MSTEQRPDSVAVESLAAKLQATVFESVGIQKVLDPGIQLGADSGFVGSFVTRVGLEENP